MLERIYLLFEILSILLFLWVLHGSKKRPGIVTIIYLCLELIIMSMINEGWISKEFDYFAFIGIVLVDIFEFNDKLRNAIFYTIADCIFVFVAQTLGLVVYAIIFHDKKMNSFEAFVVCLFILCTFIIIFLKFDLHSYISSFLEKSFYAEGIIIVFLIILLIMLKQESYKISIDENLIMFLLLFFSITILIIVKLGTERMQKNQYVEQLKQYEQYNIIYQDLISEIRHRQHDFDNHLQAIYSMSMSCRTIEELQKEEEKYFEQLMVENHSYKLLRENVSSVLTAFLYMKFKEVKDKGINIEYNLHIDKLEKVIPFPDVVELVGNLLDNAVEATIKNQNKNIYFEVEERVNEVIFILSNPYEWVEGESFNKYMVDGKSTKGNGRGFGLTNINKIVERYHGFMQVLFDCDQEVKVVRFEIALQFKLERS